MYKLDKEIEELVLANMKLAYDIANKFYSKVQATYEYEDAQQVCLEGLIRAAKSYDNTRGIAFSTYAYRVIKNALLNKSIANMKKREGTGITMSSLDELLADGETTLIEIIPSHYDLEEEHLLSNDIELLYKYIDELKPLHRDIMLLRLQDKTFEEIAGVFGYCEQYICKCYQRALNILRDKFRLNEEDHYE